MSGSEIETLKSLAGSHHTWAEWATLAVFLGLPGEIAIVFMFTKDKPRREIILSAICAGIIAFGVLGELIFGSRAARENAQIQSISDRKVADLNVEAGDARKKAGDAEERAGKADERASKNEKDAMQLKKEAASLRKAAEDERLARVKVEGKLANRRLTPEQQQSIALKLRKFAGQRVNLFVYSEDQEILDFANDIFQALAGPNGANLVVSFESGRELRNISGVLIEFGSEFNATTHTFVVDPTTQSVANELAVALRNERVSVTGAQHLVGRAVTHIGGTTDPNARIFITIGKKP